ncbi:flavin monoamine oxidase family protein [Aspergillus mulundensis]|uniref:Amine oxidase n=1 Tax=Aspergillus mulundensis TaxID=1810919 RepID=A0A3D8T580_9EURO|nr:Amine oxidase [Aspergillus mulundensis]RDW93689.1 Amine oxidase [Aspergillus mulundensis]
MAKSQEGFAWSAEDGFQYGLSTAAVMPSTPKDDLSPSYDAIVIGAGFAGLTAARDLESRGKRVLLVEARDRIGGRCWTAQTNKTSEVEIGGAWVHWQQPHVFSELQRYGLDDFKETVAFPENCECAEKPWRNEPVVVHSPVEGAAMMEQMEALMAKFFDVDGEGGRSVIPFPFNMASSIRHNPAYLHIDQLSLSDRVDQIEGLDEEQRAMLRAHVASFNGTAPEICSFGEALHTHALCNYDPAMSETATMRYKIAAGTTGFALVILNDFKGHRILNSPVQAIAQAEGEDHPVTVTLKSGEQYRSKAVISTIPEAFSQGSTPATTDKLLVYTSTEFKNGFNISCEGGDMPYASGFIDGMAGGESLLTLLVHPGQQFNTCVDNLRLIASLRPDGIQVNSVYAHLWSADPYAGGVMPVRKPGFLNKYHSEIRKPHGRVYFCGSDFADGWRGFISGAFEDAYRVTREILACELASA